MPIKKNPLLGNCYRCKEWILIKFVPRKKRYSLKNDLDFWTNQKTDQEKKICDSCLKDLYRNHKREYLLLITGEVNRQNLRDYITRRII